MTGHTFAALVVIAAPALAHAQSDPLAGVLKSMGQLRSQYLSITGGKQTWAVTVASGSQSASGGMTIYLGASKYRYTADPLGDITSTQYEIAFDGSRYEILDKATGVLSYRVADSKQSPFGLPLPSMLAWDFLSQDDDGCDSCKLRSSDLSDSKVWDRFDSMTLISDGSSGTVVQFPGGTLDGTAFNFRVTFQGTSPAQVPTQIDRVASDGTLFTRVTLSNYAPFSGTGGSVSLAQTITISAISGGPTSDTVTFTLSEFILPGESDLGTTPFEIDFARATSVWDSDEQVFIVSP